MHRHFQQKKQSKIEKLLQRETRQNYKVYRNLRKEAKAICRTKKMEIIKHIEKIEDLDKMGNNKQFYKNVNWIQK